MPRKTDILNVSSKLFSERGYSSTGVRDIAVEVGIEPGSLYAHYRSKEDILWDLALTCADDFEGSVGPLAESPLNPRAKLEAMIEAHVNVMLRHRHAASVFVSEWRFLGPERKALYTTRRNAYEMWFREVIDEGVRNGVFRPVDPKFGALTILSALNWLYQWYNPEGELTPNEVATNLAEILLHGFLRTH